MTQVPMHSESRDDSAEVRVTQSSNRNDRLQQQLAELSRSFDSPRIPNSHNKASAQNNGAPPPPYIPSYIEDHSVQLRPSQPRLTMAHLAIIRANPELWAGIKDFTIERQMRAIDGWIQTNNMVGYGGNESRVYDHGRTVAQESRSSSQICRDGCKGKSWGPHAIHICE